jgi:hypothetical protein
MMPDWQRSLLTTVNLEAAGQKAKMRLTWVPPDTSEKELAFFAASMDGVGKGWELLADVLPELG